MPLPKVSQSLRLAGITIANGIVVNRGVAHRPGIEDPSDRPVCRVARSLRPGEEVQVDAVFSDHQEEVNVLVDPLVSEVLVLDGRSQPDVARPRRSPGREAASQLRPLRE